MKYKSLMFFLSLLCGYTISELYTALADLEELLQTEGVLIETLEHYIKTQEDKLDLLRRYVNKPRERPIKWLKLSRYAEAYKHQHSIAADDIQGYVANPINAYVLVKRLTSDWRQVEKLMNSNIGEGTWKT